MCRILKQSNGGKELNMSCQAWSDFDFCPKELWMSRQPHHTFPFPHTKRHREEENPLQLMLQEAKLLTTARLC
jgi:hypothetical protein